jgi:protein TonB
VGGAVVPPRKIVHVAPVYPPLAIAIKREGRVILEAVIAENGDVRAVKVLGSVPLLDQAAIDAVRQWRFTPTTLNGQPVPVIMSVTVFFRLN